eukprot:XP_016664456.1 PREDICTED: RNA-directed DNA polymerase from mobile element jockey-like [Acyrthosiphon pisum]
MAKKRKANQNTTRVIKPKISKKASPDTISGTVDHDTVVSDTRSRSNSEDQTDSFDSNSLTTSSESLLNSKLSSRNPSTERKINIRPIILNSNGWKIQSALRNYKIAFTSFTLPEDHTLKVVIRGIPTNITEEEVTTELELRGFNVKTVKRLSNSCPLPMCLVILSKTPQATTIFKITAMFYISVRVETFKKSDQTTKLPNLSISSTSLNELSSDHNPVLLQINNSPITSSPPTPPKRINWNKYTNTLDTLSKGKLPPINTRDDINHAIASLTSKAKEALESSKYEVNNKLFYRDRLPPEIINEIKVKNRKRREWQRYRDPATKKLLNLKTAFIKSMLTTHKQDEWDKFLFSIDTTDGSIYKLNKKLLKKSPETHPLMGPNGLTLFANTYQQQFTPNKGPFLVELTHIFNGCLRLCYFPDVWKRGQIITIPKPGKNHADPVSYRPIILLSSIAKVFEIIILAKLKSKTEHLIREEQFAFRKQHSTTLQLLKLTDELCKNRNDKKITPAIFLDVEKAFDKVWHEGLLNKLLKIGTPIHLVKLIESFLSSRCFNFRVENSVSTNHPISAGVPQGSWLSPYLYLVYTNDIPVNDNCRLALFADDTMFYTTNRNPRYAILALQKQVDIALS